MPTVIQQVVARIESRTQISLLPALLFPLHPNVFSKLSLALRLRLMVVLRGPGIEEMGVPMPTFL